MVAGSSLCVANYGSIEQSVGISRLAFSGTIFRMIQAAETRRCQEIRVIQDRFEELKELVPVEHSSRKCSQLDHV